MNEHSKSKKSLDKTPESSDLNSNNIGKEFLWARFQHNRNKLQESPEFEALFSKQGEWTEEDVETFKTLIGKLKL